MWASFDHLPASKTKAHATQADVERGATTDWERKANDHADRLAKQGAALHGVTDHMQLEYRSLASLAFQAARWATDQAVLLRRAAASDCDQLPERNWDAQGRQPVRFKRRRTAQRQSLQQVLAAARLDILSNSSPASFLGHSLRVSEVETRGAVLFCTACGAYAWSAPRALMRRCAGRALSPGRAAQRSRLARNEFPSGKKRGWQLGPARPPSPAVLQYLSDTAGRRSALGARSPSATAIGGPYPGLSRAELLRYYGLTEASLRALTEKTRQIEEARKAGPREPLDPQYFEWQSSGDESKSSDLP